MLTSGEAARMEGGGGRRGRAARGEGGGSSTAAWKRPGRTAARKRRRACAAAACPARGGVMARGDGVLVHRKFRQHLPRVGCSALHLHRVRLDGSGEEQGGARVNIPSAL